MPRKNNRLPSVRGVKERNALAVKWLDLVPWVIFRQGKAMKRLAMIVGPQDAVQEGRIALLRAAELWRPSHGKFSTYAISAVRGAVHRMYAHRNTRKRRAMVVGLDDCPEHCLWTPQTAENVTDIADGLRSVLERLPKRDRIALVLRHGLDGGGVRTLDELGRALSVTRERARQIEARAFRRLEGEVLKPRLAALLGLRRCGICAVWADWPHTCTKCGRVGCPVCVQHHRQRGERFLCCARCLKETTSVKAEKPPVWEPPLPPQRFIRSP